MNTGNGADSPSLVERAKAILLRPAEEWPRIAKEDTPTRDILKQYVIPLTLIGPLATLIGGQVFGYFPFGLPNAAILAVWTFLLVIISFLVLATVSDFLAPKFGGTSSYVQSFKLVAYASTAAWLAGIFALVPALSVFGFLGLYSIYLIYTGSTPMMNVPKEKAFAYTAVVFVCAILINLAIGALNAANVQFLHSMGLLSSEDIPGHLIR